MEKYKKEFEVCLEALKKASKAVLEIYNSTFEVNYKSDNTEITNADLTSNKIIIDDLSKSFPTYSILSEETKDDLARVNNDYCFIIDPIDGTKDFVNKTNTFSINLALCYKHEIVMGFISVPYFNKIYYAVKDQGAYKLENDVVSQIHCSNKTKDLTIFVSNFFFKNQKEMEENPLIKAIVPTGSSYKACLIAEGLGELAVKFDNHTKEWDTAPMDIILKEAGGIILDAHGNTMSYNKVDFINQEGWIATNCLENLNKFKR